MTRSRLVLDQEAWDELAGLVKHAYERGFELEKEAAERLKKVDHEGERRAGLVMLLFERLPTVPGADAAKHPGKSRAKPKPKSAASA
jgi:hypothetical protein